MIAYYESVGYACTDPRPSARALGFVVRSCEWVEAPGRTLVVGVVTDGAGAIANGFASVQGAAGGDRLNREARPGRGMTLRELDGAP